MPKFVTIAYGDQEGYERTPENVRNRAHTHDALLVRQGTVMGIAGAPTQVRNPEAAGVRTKPFGRKFLVQSCIATRTAA